MANDLDTDMTNDLDIQDFPVVKAKTPTQIALDKLQAREREKANSTPLHEEEVKIPSDIDATRLREIAKELTNTTVSPVLSPIESVITDSSISVIKDYSVIPPDGGGLKVLVISVTTIPFTPMRVRANEQSPVALQKYHVLVETSQPLQLGKEYQIIP